MPRVSETTEFVTEGNNKMKYAPMLLVVLGLALLPTGVDAAQSPNLIVIMADDLGYSDVGFNGCQDIPTPHIDSIATGGVKFTNGYVSYSVCGPSRAGFMTGRYEQRFGFERNPQYRPDDPNMGLPLSQTTIADALGRVGYRCGVVGKWHLGAHETLHPLQRGFHEFFGHLGGGHQYFPEELTIEKSTDAKDEHASYRTWILHNHTPTKTTEYLTDEFSAAAVRFIKSSQRQPFFLFLAYNAPHTPLQATEKYLSRFENIADKKRRTYAAMVSAVDDGVGRVLEAVRQGDREQNTLVFFLSDNGGPETKNASDNGPLRGAKGDVYEGGFRVPFAAKWPAVFPQGTVYDKPVMSLDIFATVATASGAKANPQCPLDGVDLVPFLTGKKSGAPHETVYLRKFDGGAFAVRHGDFKQVITGRTAKPQLFNLQQDLGETTNLAEKNTAKLDEIDGLRKKWNAELIEPRFLGLVHTEAWQRKLKRQAQQKQQQQKKQK